MALLSDLDIARCEQCGKLFAFEEGKPYCTECSQEMAQAQQTPDEAAAQEEEQAPLISQRESELVEQFSILTGLSRASVLDVFEGRMKAKEVLEAKGGCVRCQERARMDDSQFCLSCALELHNAFGDAARSLFDTMEILEYDPSGPTSVIASYREKRNRTATSRINPSGGRSLKRYG